MFVSREDLTPELPLVDLSEFPEFSSQELYNPFAVALDGPDVEVISAPVRSVVTQAAQVVSGLGLLRGKHPLTDPLRASIAYNVSALIDSMQVHVPRDIEPEECRPSDLVSQLLVASKAANLKRFYGLVSALAAEKTSLVVDLPWVEWGTGEKVAYSRILQSYRDARASDSIATKLAYVDRTFGEELIPRMTTDVAYFQAVSMLLSYMHIEVPQREISIPIQMECTTMFNAEDARRLMSCRRFVLRDWLMQTSGPFSGVKVRIWEAMDGHKQGGQVFMVDCMGTNSVSRVRDRRLQKMGVVTGSLADIDPKGILATAFDDLRNPVVERLRALIPTDALVICTGHSLGATTAHRCYAELHQLGYDGAYLLGYNGGAFADPIPPELATHASTHANFILNQGDPVPFGGQYLLPGTVKTNKIVHGGTIASGNPLWGIHADPIGHGNAEEVVAAYLGLPARYSIQHSSRPHEWFMHRLNQAVLNWAPIVHEKVITTVLKPEDCEWAPHQRVSYVSKPTDKS